MGKKLLFTYVVIILMTISITVLFSISRLNEFFIDENEKDASYKMVLLQEVLKNKTDADLQEFAEEYGDKLDLRITMIDSSGKVLADSESDVSEMENHQYRPEFKSALKGQIGSSVRYSQTLGYRMFYYASSLDLPNLQGAIRIAEPMEKIKSIMWDVGNYVIVSILIGTMMSIIVAYLITRSIMTPINELSRTAKLIAAGDYDHKVYIDNQDQLGELAEAFNSMTFRLRKNIWEIEHKNAELESILVSMNAGLLAVDENYQIILCNQNFQGIFDIHGEVVGKAFYEATRNVGIFNLLEKAVEENALICDEVKLGSKKDEKIYKVTASPIRKKKKDLTMIGTLLVVEDVTNLRKLENMRRDFVSNVTHELKTPLTSIKGFVETLKTGALEQPEVAHRFLDIIDIESDRLASLINDILTLSEIENIRRDQAVQAHDFSDIVDEVSMLFRKGVEEKGIELYLEYQPELPKFLCNRNRMKQLLINLMDNAIKYTEKGSVTVSLRLSNDKASLILKVTDTGIGIPDEDQERIFERFYRVDKGRSRKMGGTGLGLSIVKHIVELYQGQLELRSKINEGTSIRIAFPLETQSRL